MANLRDYDWLFREDWNRKVLFNRLTMKACIHTDPQSRLSVWESVLLSWSVNAVGEKGDPICFYDSQSGITFTYRQRKITGIISKIVLKQKIAMLTRRVVKEIQEVMEKEKKREQTAVLEVFNDWGISLIEKDYECFIMERENITSVRELFQK